MLHKQSFIEQPVIDAINDRCRCISASSVIHHESTHAEAAITKVIAAIMASVRLRDHVRIAMAEGCLSNVHCHSRHLAIAIYLI